MALHCIHFGGRKYTVKSDIKDTDQVIAMKLHLETILNIAKEGDPDKVAANIDLDSAIDMYLVYEQMRNLDAGWSSFYLYFYEPHGKLYFGPPWDFDLSGGNSYNCHEATGLYVGHHAHHSGYYIKTVNEWFGALLTHEWFREMVRDRFNEKSADMLEVINDCCKYAYVNMEYLDKNFEKWDVMNVLINQEPIPLLALENCTEQVEYLGSWLLRRHTWLGELYNSDKFMSDYDAGPETEYGVTDVIDADVWTIADWFEGDKMAQILMDVLFTSVETRDGRIYLEFGTSWTVTPDNFAKLMLEEPLGAEPGRYTIVFEDGALESLLQKFGPLGYDQAAIEVMKFKIVDTQTGEESLVSEYAFCIMKNGAMDEVLGGN